MKRDKGVLVRMVEAIGPAEVRIFFSDGSVVERRLPGVKRVRHVKIVDGGLGIDPGDGKGEVSARVLALPSRGNRVYRMDYRDP